MQCDIYENDEVPESWMDLCTDDESDDTGIYDVSVPDSWLDLCSDDESDNSEMYDYDIDIPVSWDEEVDAITNSDAGYCMTKMSDKMFHDDDDTSKMKGNLEHEHKQNGQAKQLHCEESIPHIQIQINSLQPSEVESENKNASQDRSSVLFIRKKAKKCRPSAKKRRQAKAKKTDESQIQTVESTSHTKNCDVEKDSKKSTDVSDSSQVPSCSFYLSVDDEFSDFTEEEDNTNSELDDDSDDFIDFNEDEESDELDDDSSNFSEENDEFDDEYWSNTDSLYSEFNENWTDVKDTFCTQYEGNWLDAVSLCSKFDENWTVSYCSQFNEKLSHQYLFCSEFNDNFSDAVSCSQIDGKSCNIDSICSELSSPLNLSLICPVQQQEIEEDDTFTKHLKDINRAWGIGINRGSSSSSLNNEASNPKKNKKKVHFPSNDKISDVCHMTTWSYASIEARIGPWQQYARDHERFQRRIKSMENILSPVLLPEHRNQILSCSMYY